MLSGKFAARLVRSLADLVAARMPELERNDTIRIADSQIASVRLWITGETPSTARALAEKMISSAQAQRAAFSKTPS